MEKFSQEEALIERIRWLIRLRWIAAISLIATVFFATRIVNIPLAAKPLYSIAAFLLLYNLASFFYTKRLKTSGQDKLKIATSFANFQISIDLVALSSLIHFSGGIENPFIFYFIFHMIIASILLSRKASYLQATFAAFLFSCMVSLEYFGILNHYSLKGFMDHDLHRNNVYIVGVSFVFISTLYLAVYMASSISVRLRQREKALREANVLLEEKDRIKSEYVLRVSHDIKEHLSAIESCIEPVTSGITGELNEKQKDLLGRADQRTQKLTFFVKALLEITRIKLSKHIEMNYFSFKKTLDSAVAFVEAGARDKGIAIRRDVDANIDTIKGDEVYIEETIANILANAVKYTPRGGRIDISVKDKDASILIKISDTGIGIPEDEIPRIFDEFYRASNAKEIERTGTGLGLAIAKQVVERHNGKIWAESDLEKGTTFNILLPK